MLSLYKRKDVWHIRGTVTDGNRVVTVRKSTGQTAKRKAVEICRYIEDTILTEMKGGISMLPFITAANTWLSIKPRGATDKYITDILKKHFANYQLNHINQDAWQHFVAKNLYGRKPSNINRYRATFVSILNTASVSPKITKEKEFNDRIRFLTYEEQERLLAEYPAFIRLLFITLCYQGLRLSEAVSLLPPHINLEANTLLVEKSKNGKRRIMPMHDRVRKGFWSLDLSRSTSVFTNSAGVPYADPRNLRGVHVRSCRRAGITDFTIHDWRHHWASRLVMAGASMPVLMKLGGWSSERMVLRYASVSDEHTTDTLMRLK
ncbi:MAG: hypothetical protein CL525_14390 [Aequorivita sp.]|nr:hypothetical protein [Aequorivita sp.]